MLGAALAFALLAPVAGVGGCADFERGPPAPEGEDDGGGIPGDGDGVSFAAGPHQVLLDGCGSCHAAGGSASGTALSLSGDPALDHDVVLALVQPQAPASSRLLTKAAGTSHGGGTIFPVGSADYEILLTWISEGALP